MNIKIIIVLLTLVILAGCAAREASYVITPPISAIPGVYHEIKKGETLWSISKAYDVDIERLAKINRIPDKTKVCEGQLIFIPEAKEVIKISWLDAKSRSFIWPTKGKIISYFGNIVDNQKNKGIDISVSRSQNILAANDGRVVFIGKALAGYGDTIIVEHQNNLSTVYSNVGEIKTKLGKRISQGDIIASAKEGDAFHFEVRKDSQSVNPLFYLL